MDPYAGTLPTTQQPYSSLPSIAPGQLQQHTTLPPLQAQHTSTMSPHLNMYQQHQQQPLSAPHTPTTTTPNTPGSVGNGGFQQINSQAAQRGYHPQGNSYQQPLHAYNTSSAMMPQASTAMSHPQAIAPAPAPSHARGLVPLRPNTSTAPMHPQHAMHPHLHSALSSPYGQQHHDQEQPTHVVGSQGRRGILPSAPGRPPVGTVGTGSAKNAPIPAKDADGKFPCPHCTKTYLHAKHLKRHLLRHTGDRPYMCVLCKDTFSRSDILKRHFQKCSIRRGNPTGATHLEFAQSHLKKPHSGSHKNSNSSSADGDLTRNMNGAHALSGDPNNGMFMMSDGRIGDGHPNMAGDEAEHLSHANGLKRLSNGGAPRDRRSLTGPGPSGSSRASFDQNYNGDVPTSIASSINPQLAAYAMPNGHNGANYGQNYDFAHQQSNGGSVHHQDDAGGSRGVMYGDHQQAWGGVGQMFTTDGN